MSVNNNLQVGSGRIRVEKFTASGSWVAPAGVYSIQALAVGGGGGGGAARSNNSTYSRTAGAGGGGGVIDDIFPVVPGTTYTVTIGTGGAGANTTTAAGSNGTNTTFGSLFTAPGGQGGVTRMNDTSVAPTSNPGGSMGGWSFGTNGANYITAGHGCGAATPILLAAISSVAAVGDQVYNTSFTFFNGISNVTIPIQQLYEFGPGNLASIGANTDTATTYFRGVKRNIISGLPQEATVYLAGYSWKGLGAGGMSVMHNGNASNTPRGGGTFTLIDPTAGSVPNTNNAEYTANNAGYPGTNGVANTGAGGGGSHSGGTDNTIRAGGTGGSGYVEILWQE
jgi:hypothetical protein